jgi:hypothetical protein
VSARPSGQPATFTAKQPSQREIDAQVREIVERHEQETALEAQGIPVLARVRRRKDPWYQSLKVVIELLLKSPPGVADVDWLFYMGRTCPIFYDLSRVLHGVENDPNYDVTPALSISA